MKKQFLILLAIVFLVNTAGCDAIQRKFTRKKKTVKAPRFYQLKKYARKPPADLYKQHYAYWVSWQGEIIKVIGQNRKKDQRCMEEAIGHLKDMQNLLIDEKADSLEIHIERMEDIKAIIMRGELSPANKDYAGGVLDREDRAIKREFCYGKIKDFIRTGADEEPKK